MGTLTTNFNIAEFVVSKDYPELLQEVTDYVTDFDIYKFFLLARMILEPVRAKIGKPITITSGKRSKALNNAIGGAPYSDHLYQNETAACDFKLPTSPDTEEAFSILTQTRQLYGQLIAYPNKTGSHTFIHVSLPSKKHHGEILEKVNGVFRKVL